MTGVVLIALWWCVYWYPTVVDLVVTKMMGLKLKAATAASIAVTVAAGSFSGKTAA